MTAPLRSAAPAAKALRLQRIFARLQEGDEPQAADGGSGGPDGPAL